MKNCIFCKIAKGEIPCHKIYEDENYLAFLDIAPVCEGHTLVIPKKHYHWVWEIEDLDSFAAVIKKIAKHYQKKTKNDFVASFVWGLDVPHAHIHLLPDPQSLHIPGKRKKLSEAKAKKLLKKLSLSQKG